MKLELLKSYMVYVVTLFMILDLTLIDKLAIIERRIDALDLREREKPMVDKEIILKVDDD